MTGLVIGLVAGVLGLLVWLPVGALAGFIGLRLDSRQMDKPYEEHDEDDVYQE